MKQFVNSRSEENLQHAEDADHEEQAQVKGGDERLVVVVAVFLSENLIQLYAGEHQQGSRDHHDAQQKQDTENSLLACSCIYYRRQGNGVST